LLFLAKRYEVLISTTVIEVGIDIPDANIILINDAHRFGLAQLHQLRGRVGRGNKQAYCILVTKDNYVAANNSENLDLEYLSSTQIERYKASVRLQTMVKYNDGFKVAEIDLKLRGPGDIFGTKQSGFPELKFVDIIKDTEIIREARLSAFKIINDDPQLNSGTNSILKNNFLKHYSKSLEFAKIA
jgi:ATP-dependent DNA helicase RecG